MSGETNDTDHMTEARRMAMRSIEDWEYLSDEEKYGSLHEIVDQLAKAEKERRQDTDTERGEQ